MSDNGLTTGEQARMLAIGKLGNELSHQLENWLSPWGNANVNLRVDKEGNFTGSQGNWFIPLQDNGDYLTGISIPSPSGKTIWWGTLVWDSAGEEATGCWAITRSTTKCWVSI